jgi:hypothetical protein
MEYIMSEYYSRFYKVPELAPAQRLKMQDLYLSCYDATSPEIFQSDLESKSETQMLYHRDELVGFSTYLFYDWSEQTARIVFSGDTIIHPDHWGKQGQLLEWLGRMGEFEREAPKIPLYWFLIVKGHRTFRILPIFAKSFHPHWNEERPDLRGLADTLAENRFGVDFDPTKGVVSFAEPRGQLMAHLAEPSETEMQKETVRFFMSKNPGYRQGDELVCLCRLCPENLRPLPKRHFLAGSLHG